MGEKTAIAWADHTFNPWIGCQKVSAGCDHCYAETLMDTRYHRVAWGQRKTNETEPSVGTRIRTSVANWRLPMRWAKKAREAQEDFEVGMLTLRPPRPRVFCSSLADVFDNQVEPQWRSDLWQLICDTPELDWLLLTKRPENISRMLPRSWGLKGRPGSDGIMPNVWLGTTCEDQAAFDHRWPILQKVPAAVRFISYEPAIGPLYIPEAPGLNWLICGGESGPEHRPMDPEWAALVKNDCCRLEIPFFMKQMAGLKPIPDYLMRREFPNPLRVQQHH